MTEMQAGTWRREAARPDVLTVTIGILIALAGVLALAAGVFTTAVTIVVIGSVLLAAAVGLLVDAIGRRRERSPWREVFAGALYGAVGLIFIFNPVVGAVAVTALLTAMLFAAGVARIVGALMERGRAWGWMLFSGVVSTLLGIYVVATWPLAAAWLIGTVVGVELIATGIGLAGIGFMLRERGRPRPEAERRFEAPREEAAAPPLH